MCDVADGYNFVAGMFPPSGKIISLNNVTLALRTV
jgi:hypothetical protein